MPDPIASTGEKRGRRLGGKDAPAASSEPVHEPAKESVRDAGALERPASGLGEQLRATAESLLSEQKDRVAAAAHGLADALRQGARAFEREESPVVAHYADAAAAQIDRVSETMRRQSLQDMLASAEDVARRQPALFFTGALAIGFVVGRMLSLAGDDHRRAAGDAMTAGESGDHAASALRSGAGIGGEPS